MLIAAVSSASFAFASFLARLRRKKNLHKLDFAQNLQAIQCNVVKLMERYYVGWMLIVKVDFVFSVDLDHSNIFVGVAYFLFLFVDDHLGGSLSFNQLI